MIRKQSLLFISLFFALLPISSSAAIFILYDEIQNNLPDEQPWLTYFADGGGEIATAINGVGVNLQTEMNTSAGFSNYPIIPFGFKNPQFPELDSSTGFTLSFSMKLNQENHLSDFRSGFSVILLDKNNLGVELGFWQDSIWSQDDEPLFTNREEHVDFQTNQTMISYDLTLINGSYYLSTNNTILLSGSLKDYSAFNGGPSGSLPYSLTNYLFLGDNTSSASAEVTIGQISLSDTPQYRVPLPSSVIFYLLAD